MGAAFLALNKPSREKKHANTANNELTQLLNLMNSEGTKNMINGLRALRLSAFRKNATHNKVRIQVEECTPVYRTEIDSLLQDTFTDE